jgi:phage FluMu protein Com
MSDSEAPGTVFIQAKCPHCGRIDVSHFKFMEYSDAEGGRKTAQYRCTQCTKDFTLHVIVASVNYRAARVTRYGGQICFDLPKPQVSPRMQSLRRLKSFS